jgi:hypothetical protein
MAGRLADDDNPRSKERELRTAGSTLLPKCRWQVALGIASGNEPL